MGIYMNMLRETDEFLGNTGFDDDGIATPDDGYAVELKDVAQTIEDINDDYAEQSSQKELDGQDLTSNPVEECMIAIYENEHNWNEIMKGIGTRELMEAARGTKPVMESWEGVKSFFTKIKDFFVKMFKKITAIVKNWMANASAAFRTNKSFLSKYGSKLGDGKKAYESSNKNKSFKGYEFSKAHFTIDNYNGFLEGVKKANKICVDLGNKMVTAINNGTEVEISKDEATASALTLGFGKMKEETSADEIKETFFGNAEKVTLSGKELEPDTLRKALADSSKAIKTIKTLYSEVKKGFDDVIKVCNNIEKAIKNSSKKGEYDEDYEGSLTAASQWASMAKKSKHAVQKTYTMFMKATHVRTAQARKIANAYIFALNKGTRKDTIDRLDGKTKTEAGFLANVELI